jgi:hypothetical protein
LGQQTPQLQETQPDKQNQHDGRKFSMVGPRIPPGQPVVILHRAHEMDQGERVAENDIQVDKCHNLFIPSIMNFEMPANFKFAVQIDLYDRTTDPQDHIEIFQQTMVFQGAKELVICQAFPLTLKVAVRRWFSSLPAGSCSGWKVLKDKFVSNFTSSKQQFKTEHHLERIKQKSYKP